MTSLVILKEAVGMLTDAWIHRTCSNSWHSASEHVHMYARSLMISCENYYYSYKLPVEKSQQKIQLLIDDQNVDVSSLGLR